MSTGLIVLVSRCKEDNYLIGNPQITMFKNIYRRHTNFIIQQIPVSFLSTANFNQKISLSVEKVGDLVNKMYLVITLPELPQLYNLDGSKNEIIKYAWSKNIGYVIINYIELEINGKIVDRQYGEWMKIWHDLIDIEKPQYNKMTGNIKELFTFTSSKPEYKLFIPIHFYFCDTISLSLPLLDYLNIQINVELNDLSKCLRIAPSHYIDILDPFVNLEIGETLKQTQENQKLTFGEFIHYDQKRKRLYYQKSTYETFKDNTFIYSKNQLLTPYNKSQPYIFNNQPIINLKDCFMLLNYVYLDKEERLKVNNNNQNIIITQIQKNNLYTSDFNYISNSLNFNSNVLFICWFSQYKIFRETFNCDFFNFSNIENSEKIIKNCNLIFNTQYRFKDINPKYFYITEKMNKFNGNKSDTFVYSFSLFPLIYQPSGQCNFNEISDIKMEIEYNKNTALNSDIVFQCYCMNYRQINYKDFI